MTFKTWNLSRKNSRIFSRRHGTMFNMFFNGRSWQKTFKIVWIHQVDWQSHRDKSLATLKALISQVQCYQKTNMISWCLERSHFLWNLKESLFEKISSILTFTTCHKPVTSEYKHSVTFCIRCYTHLQCIRLSLHTCMLSQQRKPCTDSKSVQYCTTTGHPYHSPKLHPGSCSSVWMRQQTDRQTNAQTDAQIDTRTDIQMAVANIHFASAMPNTKCNDSNAHNHSSPDLVQEQHLVAVA